MIVGPSGVSDSMERLVKRNIELHTELQLGAFEQKDVCVIMLSDGEEIRVSRYMLGNDIESLLTSTKQLDLTTPVRSHLPRSQAMSTSRVSGTYCTVLHCLLYWQAHTSLDLLCCVQFLSDAYGPPQYLLHDESRAPSQ